jgi:hypothetical protein
MRGEEVVNVKYRTPSKKMWMETGAERIVYGYNDLVFAKDEGLSVIVVEGELDKLSVETALRPLRKQDRCTHKQSVLLRFPSTSSCLECGTLHSPLLLHA